MSNRYRFHDFATFRSKSFTETRRKRKLPPPLPRHNTAEGQAALPACHFRRHHTAQNSLTWNIVETNWLHL